MLTNRLTNRHTDTQNDYCNPRCACAPRVNESVKKRAQSSRTLAFAVTFRLSTCSYILNCFSLLRLVLGRIRSS